MAKKIAVIGAGLGGLASALRLVNKGFEVDLFEKNATPGGKIQEVTEGSFRFDTGPSVVTMPAVLDELFNDLGLRRQDYINLQKIDPICRYFWEDGQQIDIGHDLKQLKNELSRVSETDAAAFDSFYTYSKSIYETTADVFLYRPIHEISKMLSWLVFKKLFALKQIDALKTVNRGIRRFFKDRRLVQLFNRYATYSGSDPYQAPATLNIIPYVEIGMGAYYIDGGIYRLVEVLFNLAKKRGVQFYFNHPVKAILHDHGKLYGLDVGDQPKVYDAVVCNADVVSTYKKLIKGYKSTRLKLSRQEPSLSGLVFLWGVKGSYPQLKHHNVLFSDDYALEFKQLFSEKKAPDDPTIYIAITSKSNPSHAPEGYENWFVLLNMPYITDKNYTDKNLIENMRRVTIKRLKDINIDLEGKITTEEIILPQDLEQRYGANRGSIYGLSSNGRLAAFKRMANRSHQIKGLYFSGGSVHPGGGIPLVLLSARLATEQISH